MRASRRRLAQFGRCFSLKTSRKEASTGLRGRFRDGHGLKGHVFESKGGPMKELHHIEVVHLLQPESKKRTCEIWL